MILLIYNTCVKRITKKFHINSLFLNLSTVLLSKKINKSLAKALNYKVKSF